MISAGAHIGSVFSTDTAMLSLPVSDRQLALLSIPEQGEPSYEKRANVKVIGDFGSQTFFWQGELVRLAGRNEVNRLHYLTVEVDKPYAEDKEQIGRPVLSPGFFVTAEIQGKHFENIIRLPRKALKSNEKIWLVNKEGVLEAIDAQILYRGREYIFVNAGIEDGAKVVVSDLEVFASGLKVESVFMEQAEEKEYSHKPLNGEQKTLEKIVEGVEHNLEKNDDSANEGNPDIDGANKKTVNDVSENQNTDREAGE